LASKTAVRWENARSRSRQGIQEAAGEVFAKDGFESATMKRIAEVCGVTKVTVYTHFRDKARLYQVVMAGHQALMPKPMLYTGREIELCDALVGIAYGIRTLASHPSCQAFCQALMRSELEKRAYMDYWTAMLQPYRQAAVRAFANASPSSNNGEDGEKFLRLILAEQGLPQGTVPVSSSDATIALFARAYGSIFAR
jgi:AcrR family transcriptional regulator